MCEKCLSPGDKQKRTPHGLTKRFIYIDANKNSVEICNGFFQNEMKQIKVWLFIMYIEVKKYFSVFISTILLFDLFAFL